MEIHHFIYNELEMNKFEKECYSCEKKKNIQKLITRVSTIIDRIRLLIKINGLIFLFCSKWKKKV